MSQSRRIVIVVVIILVIVSVILGVDAWQRQKATENALAGLPPGSIPVFLDGELAGSFVPDDLAQLTEVSFEDAEEGKTQSGWLLADVLALYLDVDSLDPLTMIVVSSREKSASPTWAEVSDPVNMVLFDLAGRGTLKLVSLLEKLDVRDEWVQDTERIEVTRP